MKTIYYSAKWAGAGKWSVTFWTKEDKSNAITKSMVSGEESKVRAAIEFSLGHKRFELKRVK